MSYTYECRTCHEQSVSDAGWTPFCVGCEQDMVIVESEPADDQTPEPVAPINVGAYQNGLEEIETATAKANADEREFDRAKKYAAKAKASLESSEAELRRVIKAVSDRLRPRPLFEAQDTHTDEELVALLSHLNVSTTIQKVRLWTGDMKADARAWAMAAQTDQPRLIPPFLFLPGSEGAEPDQGDAGPAILEGESAVEYAKQRLGELATEAAPGQPEPAVDDKEVGHRYPKKGRKKRTRKAEPSDDDTPATDPDDDQPEA